MVGFRIIDNELRLIFLPIFIFESFLLCEIFHNVNMAFPSTSSEPFNKTDLHYSPRRTLPSQATLRQLRLGKIIFYNITIILRSRIHLYLKPENPPHNTQV